jgi:hypothetical protein
MSSGMMAGFIMMNCHKHVQVHVHVQVHKYEGAPCQIRLHKEQQSCDCHKQLAGLDFLCSSFDLHSILCNWIPVGTSHCMATVQSYCVSGILAESFALFADAQCQPKNDTHLSSDKWKILYN